MEWTSVASELPQCGRKQSQSKADRHGSYCEFRNQKSADSSEPEQETTDGRTYEEKQERGQRVSPTLGYKHHEQALGNT